MAIRGLIVAIEDYPAAKEIGVRLEGTHDAGVGFLQWLTLVKGARREDVLFCAGDGVGADVGTTKKAILDALQDRLLAWQDTTEELYVFWSGHGLTIDDGGVALPADVVVTSEFESVARSGDACVELDTLQDVLARGLGEGDHYWFLDVCRNVAGTGEVAPSGLGRRLAPSKMGRSRCRFSLHAVAQGDAARVRSAYAGALLDGLRGRGRAKGWTGPGTLAVCFDRLTRAMEHLGVEPSQRGSCPGTILVLPAPHEVRCVVEVRGATESDRWSFVPTVVGGAAGASIEFTGARWAGTLPPNDYVPQLRSKQGAHRRIAPPSAAVDLWDDATLVFDKDALDEETTQLSQLHLRLDDRDEPFMEVRVRHTETGIERTLYPRVGGLESMDSTLNLGSLPAGTWAASVIRQGSATKLAQIHLPAGGAASVDEASSLDETQRAFLSAMGQQPDGARFWLSETLGPTHEASMGLWLTLLGASRLAGDRVYSKFAQVPVDIDPTPGGIVVLVRARPDEVVRVGVTTSADKRPLGPPKAVLPGVWCATYDGSPTPHAAPLLLWKLGARRLRATRTLTTPIGTTLIVIDHDQNAASVWQFLIPRPGPHGVDFWMAEPALRRMRFAWELQRAVAEGRWPGTQIDPLAASLREHGDWLRQGEPLTALLASYADLEVANDLHTNHPAAVWAPWELEADLRCVSPFDPSPLSPPPMEGWHNTPIVRAGLQQLDERRPADWLVRVDPSVLWSTWFAREPGT